jgi:hypothetical protein
LVVEVIVRADPNLHDSISIALADGSVLLAYSHRPDIVSDENSRQFARRARRMLYGILMKAAAPII